MIRTSIFAAVLTAVTTASVSAADLGASMADLTDVQGSVFVNNSAVTGNTKLSAGDRVRSVTGSARIIYGNGAAVEVAAGQTVAVLAHPPGNGGGPDEVLFFPETPQPSK